MPSMPSPRNPFEDAARQRKVAKLVDAARAAGLTARHIHTLDDEGWDLLTQAAGVRTPSETTRQQVRDRFDRTDGLAQPADPFADLALDAAYAVA